MASFPSQETPARAAETVLILCPGGLEHGGGIGRQMGYFLNAPGLRPGPAYRVVDTRGRWFLGASPLFKGISALILARSLLALIAARLSAAPCLAHVNITGRGSTIRKLVVTAVARAVGLRYLLHVHDADYAGEFAGRGKLLQSLIKRMFRGPRTGSGSRPARPGRADTAAGSAGRSRRRAA